MDIYVQHWDAFTRQPGKGNPAGIVLNARDIDPAKMQAISTAVGFNDTAFVLPSQVADFHIRYFSPAREVDLCGHATIAAFAALHQQRLLPGGKSNGHYSLETRAGVLSIGLENSDDGPVVVMTQVNARFMNFNGARHALAQVLGIYESDLHDALPITYGSTGRWTLIVPVKDLQAIQRMRPNQAKFAAVLTEMPDASIHPFCLETINPRAIMHARHFSSAASGTLEDSVTGTASGVLGAYHQRCVAEAHTVQQPLVIEQGYEVCREGTVQVWAARQGNECAVRIAGSACFVGNMQVNLRAT